MSNYILRFAAVLAPRLGPFLAPALFSLFCRIFWRWAPGLDALQANLDALNIVSIDRNIARSGMENFGRYFGEFLSCGGSDDSSFERLLGRVELDEIRAAQSEGRGVLVVSSHYGNWELSALALGRAFGGVAVLIRKTGDSFLDERIRKCRGRNQLIDVESPGKGIRPVLETLSRGGIVAAAIDEPALSGIPVKFFGRDIFMPSPLFRIAESTGAAIIPLSCRRNASGQIDIASLPPAREAQEVTLYFEKWIREDPTQWMLFRRLIFVK